MKTGIPLSLYVHLPWCVEKCPYCDFNSHEVQGELPEQTYIDALFRNVEDQLPAFWGRRIDTMFIGGGTPSLFSGASIERLMSGLRARLGFVANMEVTLESNPGTADASNYAAYREAGINRLSIGVQSLDNEHLKTLGRIHSANEAIAAIAIAKAAGYSITADDIQAEEEDELSLEELGSVAGAGGRRLFRSGFFERRKKPRPRRKRRD